MTQSQREMQAVHAEIRRLRGEAEEAYRIMDRAEPHAVNAVYDAFLIVKQMRDDLAQLEESSGRVASGVMR